MNRSLVSLSTVSFALLAGACGTDQPAGGSPATNHGGTAGTAVSGGSAGKGGTGGTGATSGSGGTGAVGGSGMTGGASQGATAGTSSGGAPQGGAAGTGNSAGTSGATGGNSTGDAGEGGADGATSGMGGSAGSTAGTAGAATGGSAGAGMAGSAGAGMGGMGSAVPSAGCGKTRTLQDGNRSIQTNGQMRSYYLKTPSDYDNSHPYRVVFTFHWNYGSADAIVNPPDADHNTDRPFYGLADLSGNSTIYVAPDGLVSSTGGKGWSDTNGQDGKFTDDMLAAISADLCIDTSRVFTTGFSFGGAMSYKLACTRPEKFRAALVYDAGPVSGNNASQCTTPIAWFQSHGADDQTFNLQTGLGILDVFTKLNGCTAMTPPSAPTNGHTCVSFEGCSAGHPTRWCAFGSGENNPHNTSLRGHYPSPKDPGEDTSWVPAEAWEFITQF